MAVRARVEDLRRRPIVRHFVKYAIVGAWNTALFLGIFNSARALDIPFAFAYAIAFVVASFNSYVLNRHWTFRDRRREPFVRQYALFVVLTAVGVGLGELVSHAYLIFLHQYGLLGENLATIGTIPVTVLWNFLAYRRWTFKPVHAAV